jgi:ribosomal protein L20
VPAGEVEEALHMPLEVEDKMLVNMAGEDRENFSAVVLEAEDNGKDNL